MKKKSPPYAIIGAVVLGIIAIVAFIQYTKNQEEAKAAAVAAANKAAQEQLEALRKNQQPVVTPTNTNMRLVLYATQPVAAGARINSAFYEKKLTPTDILPDAYTDKDDIVGWVAIRKIEKGDPLTPRNIGKTLPYLSQRITPGMRAVTINAENNLTGGFIVDGDRIDLLYSVNTLNTDLNVQTVMQNVNVLYVPGSPVTTDLTDGIHPVASAGPIAITLEVTPEQAQALIFLAAVKNAHFSMVLRARQDNSEIKVKPFNAVDYDITNLRKVQTTVDKSIQRVDELAQEIEAKEKADQGKPNETLTPPNP